MYSMKFRWLLLLSLLTGPLPGAEAIAPTDAEMREALRYAEGQWGLRVTSKIALDAVPLNDCNPARHDSYAITSVTWSQTVLKDENGAVTSTSEPAADSYRYTIRINSACRWNPSLLGAVMTHELGHILIGAEYHSADSRSAMYWITRGHGQRVMPEDLSRVVDHGAIQPADQTARLEKEHPQLKGLRIPGQTGLDWLRSRVRPRIQSDFRRIAFNVEFRAERLR